MTKRLGLLVVETDDDYTVQLYDDVPAALVSFQNLNRAMDNRRGRATFFDVTYNEDGTVNVEPHVRSLPMLPKKGKTHCRLGEESVTLESEQDGELA